jgi:hypothetical protein
MDAERFEDIFPTRSQGNPENPSRGGVTPSRSQAVGTQPIALGTEERASKARLIWLAPSGYRIREPWTRSPRGNSDPGTIASEVMITMTGDADICR